MGVPLDRVTVRLGDSTFPVSAGSGGQWGANNSTAGVYAACVKLREMIAQKLGFNSEAEFTDGEVRAGNRRVPLAEAARDGRAEDAIEYGDLHKKYQQSTFGAHFVEVGVDIATAEIRVRRMLSVCAAGRILNPKSARSQVIGAMTMGVGVALMEELVVDKRIGFFVNHDLAGTSTGSRRHSAPGHDLLGRNRSDVVADESQRRRRTWHLWCGGRRRQRDLQCHRRTRA